ncbi:hypothetical protein KQ940_20515 [Marinobacterium sp. D7]|uniref:chemotaxis protein CheB n=1 Tax=Marinobacterium ramblicola TaxID=2849041 RepID=UPI001C2CCCDC|nr:hypothetical protein [Marinobacterium ramblicola]
MNGSTSLILLSNYDRTAWAIAGLLAAAHTIAQDEESCGVLGMEKVAIEMKAVNSVMPLDHIFASNTGGLKSEGR